ncbi:hypothetical protein KQX54_021051 [Cotesia glomerata]|uniref:Uncharacterized protein n=1 Tax=Cotesia glomerata TaxID=32391 RepID=A0AAV7I303_COTGL|nr:hypothetical protein KQX54_021051 [Cotesia glomerata]
MQFKSTYVFFWVAVVMHKDKEENSHRDSHYRAREMAALAYDHHHLDGEMFLQGGGERVHMREASEEKELPINTEGLASGARPRRVQPSLHTTHTDILQPHSSTAGSVSGTAPPALTH